MDFASCSKSLFFFFLQNHIKMYNYSILRKTNGPFLVIAPLSVLQNWLNEVQLFCPSLRAFVLHGNKKDRSKLLEKLRKPKEWDLCITSYDIVKIEVGKLSKLNWKYVVLDEGHKIKNEHTKVNYAVTSIKSKQRLLLTGTPLQVQ